MGGVAGKLGDRYEAWWTILRGVLPVLAGDFDLLRVEEPGFDAIEFRLMGAHDGGPDEGHQCKRTHKTTWTVNALNGEGFLGPWAALTDSGTHVVFVSEQRSVIKQMANKARSLADVDQWRADLADDDENPARAELEKEWAVGTEVVHRRMQSTKFEQMGEDTLRFDLIRLLNTTVTGDPEKVLGLLRGLIEDHFGEDLTADVVWRFLRGKGYEPATGFNPALSERVRETVTSYIDHVVASRPEALAHVPRSEVDRIIGELMRPDGPPVVALVGKPGVGKSHAVADVCAKLAELGTTTGVLRLDLAQPASTAAELGTQQGIAFQGSPPQILARASGSGPSVLVIDQADTASTLSGRGHTVYHALREMLKQAASTPGMKVLLACRSEDLRFDSNLRRLVGLDDPASTKATRIDIGGLAPDQVNAALANLGLDARTVPSRSCNSARTSSTCRCSFASTRPPTRQIGTS